MDKEEFRRRRAAIKAKSDKLWGDIEMSQGQVIDIMPFNPYSLQYYSFWKGKIGFARTVPVSWTTPMSISSVTVDS